MILKKTIINNGIQKNDRLSKVINKVLPIEYKSSRIYQSLYDEFVNTFEMYPAFRKLVEKKAAIGGYTERQKLLLETKIEEDLFKLKKVDLTEKDILKNYDISKIINYKNIEKITNDIEGDVRKIQKKYVFLKTIDMIWFHRVFIKLLLQGLSSVPFDGLEDNSIMLRTVKLVAYIERLLYLIIKMDISKKYMDKQELDTVLEGMDKGGGIKKLCMEILQIWIKYELITEYTATKNKRDYNHIIFKSVLWKDHIQKKDYLPPMVCKPLDWVNGNKTCYGGYCLNKRNVMFKIVNISPKWNYMIENKGLYNLLNTMQSVAYKIDKNLLKDVIMYPDKYNIPCTDILNYTGYGYKEDADWNKIFNENEAWFNEASKKNSNKEFFDRKLFYFYKERGDVIRILYTIIMGLIYSDVDIYFGYILDFRGRAYTKAYPLSPQGFDLSRALLIPYKYYAKKETIWEMNKEEWKYYSNILKDKKQKELNIYEEYEHDNIKKDYNNDNSCKKIALDVRASGYQILGLLLHDKMVLKATRFLVKDNKEEHDDIYQYIGTLLKSEGFYKKYKEMYEKNVYNKKKVASNTFELNRKVIKGIVMKLAYNEGNYNRSFTLVEHMKGIRFKDAMSLSNLLYKIIEKYFNNIIVFKEIIGNMCGNLATNYKYLFLPYNKELAIVKHAYYDILTKKVAIQIENNKDKNKETKIKKTLSFSIPNKDKLSIRKYKLASLPNFIHTLDATILWYTIKVCHEQNIPVFTIHDCFYCHPKYIKDVQKAYVIAVYKNFYEIDILENFLNNNDFKLKEKKDMEDFLKKYIKPNKIINPCFYLDNEYIIGDKKSKNILHISPFILS